jgi:protein tyrosine phosphatase (PTP) superfamily phosphohydrolase (DUF442 family)
LKAVRPDSDADLVSPRLRPLFRWRRLGLRFHYRAILWLGAGLVASAGALAVWRIATHNEAVVVPGRLYRSGQLDAAEFRDMIGRDHIRSVINLRGPNGKQAWYRDELAVCRQLRVQHYDVNLSAGHLPRPAEAAKLLADLEAAPRPILVHCNSDCNRTGFAACVYLIDQDHVPWRQAESELNWSHGHFALYPYFEMNEFVQLYGQSADPSLRDWIRRVYPSVYAEEMHESKWDEIMEPVELLVRGRLD